MNKYEKLAELITDQITQGVFGRGERLPSIRHLSQQQRVSISTVQEAYQLLERRGVTEIRPKSGHFVRAPRAGLPLISSAPEYPVRPVATSMWAKVLHVLYQTEPTEVLHLGRAVPFLNSPTLKRLQKSLLTMTKREEIRGLSYDYIFGCDELRQQIARITAESGCRLSPEEVIVTTGCQEALTCSLRAITEPGDIVISDSPSFYGLLQSIEACGLKTLEIPTHPKTGISLEAVELALEQWPVKACLLTPSFNNPLGYCMPDENKARFLQLMSKYDIAVIEDDVYGDLAFSSPRPRTLKSFDHEGRVILCSSFSKTLAPGLRVGWAAPGKYADAVMHMKYISSMSTATLPQLAIADFINKGGYDRHIKKMRALYLNNRDDMLELISHYLPDGTRATCPAGGYLLWVELPKQIDGMELADRALEAGVGVAPGGLFSTTDKYGHYIRVNFAHCDHPNAEKGIEVLGHLVKAMMMENDN